MERATQRVYSIMLDGRKYTTRQLCYLARVSDPRSSIRLMRNKGFIIRDEVVNDKELKTTYKRYWLVKGGEL